MSQSSNSESNMKVFLELSSIPNDNKINSKTIERVPKQTAVDELEGKAKKVTIEHHLQEKEVSYIASIPSDQPKVISASMMATTTIRNNVQKIHQITDEELLTMALEFEKKHPQLI